MAESKTRKQTQKTTRAAKSTGRTAAQGTKQAARRTKEAARTTREAAQVTTREASRTADQAQRTLSTVVRDGAYAVVGVGDTTVEMLRHATERAEQFRTGVPKAVQTIGPRARSFVDVVPGEVASAVRGLVTSAGDSFDGYAHRGRSVVRAVTRARPTKRAIDQTRSARSQVKAARTSVAKVVEESAEAVGAAADKVGVEGRGER